LAIALLLGQASARVARAEAPDVPADVVPGERGHAQLPALPADFIRERTGEVTWEMHPSATSIVHGLQRVLPELWTRITGDFGVRVAEELTVRIARGPRDMIRLAPQGAPPPAYAVGVAYPARGLIILSVVAPGTWLPPDLENVFAHELSHVALYRAVDGQALPLWFMEGMAVYQAREQNVERIRTLWEASVAGGVLPLSELSGHFPSATHEVNLAYAQSADLVNHLLRDPEDREQLGELLARVRGGKPFELALLGAYRFDLATLERDWRHSLRERFQLWPLLVSGTAIWAAIGVLAVVAFVRRRKQHREKLQGWAKEEAAYDRAIQALEISRAIPVHEPMVTPGPDAEVSTIATQEPGIPTVEHEGQRYTLH
jgi:hypothetical protein